MYTLNANLALLVLLALLFISAFFSASETALMSVNRYRIRHLAQLGSKSAKRIITLLQKPDRLLGSILIGNTFANIMASAVATTLAIHWWGDNSLALSLSTAVLTLLVLIIAEIAPKTLAVLHSQKYSLAASGPLKLIFYALYPLVWLVTQISNALLRILGVKMQHAHSDRLSRDELRSVVKDSASFSLDAEKEMLLRILDLEKMTVNDAMIPRNQIVSIDLNEDLGLIRSQLLNSQMKYIPVYEDDINDIQGILPVFAALELFFSDQISPHSLRSLIEEPHFIPEESSLFAQIKNFKLKNLDHAFIVDEYGDILGLMTVGAIVQEIMGKVLVDKLMQEQWVEKDEEGSYRVKASINVRDLNELMQWEFPSEGPRTLNGAITEYLEAIPEAGVCLYLAGYPIEIIKVRENKIEWVKVFPQWRKKYPKS